MKGYFERKWEKTSGICIKGNKDDEKGTWYNGQDVWKYLDKLSKGDEIEYKLSEDKKKVIFINPMKGENLTQTDLGNVPKNMEQHFLEVKSCLRANYEKIENLENMVGSIIEKLEMKPKSGEKN